MLDRPAVRPTVFMAIYNYLQMLTEINECGAFIREFKLYSLDLASIITATFHVILDRNLLQCGSLIASQHAEI